MTKKTNLAIGIVVTLTLIIFLSYYANSRAKLSEKVYALEQFETQLSRACARDKKAISEMVEPAVSGNHVMVHHMALAYLLGVDNIKSVLELRASFDNAIALFPGYRNELGQFLQTGADSAKAIRLVGEISQEPRDVELVRTLLKAENANDGCENSVQQLRNEIQSLRHPFRSFFARGFAE